MKIEIPEQHLNGLQRESLARLFQRAKGMHYANVQMRINGGDEVFEVDWLRHAVVIEPSPETVSHLRRE